MTFDSSNNRWAPYAKDGCECLEDGEHKRAKPGNSWDHKHQGWSLCHCITDADIQHEAAGRALKAAGVVR
jgi:hypothetical protein